MYYYYYRKGGEEERSKYLHVNHSPNIQENNSNKKKIIIKIKKRPNKRDIMME